jgi:hypothetical protein
VGFGAWRVLGGLLAHGMRRDENVHLHSANILAKLHAKATTCQTAAVYPTCIIKITKVPYFTRHFVVFLHSFHGLALVPWFIPAYPAYFSVFRTPKNTAVRCTLCVKIIRSC